MEHRCQTNMDKKKTSLCATEQCSGACARAHPELTYVTACMPLDQCYYPLSILPGGLHNLTVCEVTNVDKSEQR